MFHFFKGYDAITSCYTSIIYRVRIELKTAFLGLKFLHTLSSVYTLRKISCAERIFASLRKSLSENNF